MTRYVVAVALAVALAACNDPSLDTRLCYQTYEFGNTGCAQITGLVRDPQGAPIDSALVSVWPIDEARVVLTGHTRTSSTGSYDLRVIRYTEPLAESPDTITVRVAAALPPAPGTPIGTAGPVGYAFATLELRPVGESPVKTEVTTITIDLAE